MLAINARHVIVTGANLIYNGAMNQAFYLYSLQQIDLRIDKIEKRLAEINRILASDKTVASAAAKLEQARKALASAQQLQRNVDAEAHELHVKMELSEASLYGGKIRNPKELQSLQDEIKSLKARLEAMEERQMEAMIGVEDAEGRLTASSAGLEKAQAELLEKNASLAGEKKKLDGEKAERLAERDALLPSVQPDSLDAYDRLRKSHGVIAVARIDETACAACGSVMTPADVQRARSPLALVYCPSCGRILYSG